MHAHSEIPLFEVKTHNTIKSVWIVIHDYVYDVTHFLNEHPGGADVLLSYAGKDGTQAFEDVSHSADARTLMKNYMIGILQPQDRGKGNTCKDPCCYKATSKSRLKHISSVRARKSECVMPCVGTSTQRSKKMQQEKSRGTFDTSEECPTGSSLRLPQHDKDDKPWRTFDDDCVEDSSSSRTKKTLSKDSKKKKKRTSSNRLKWAALALAGALIIGLVLRKYMA